MQTNTPVTDARTALALAAAAQDAARYAEAERWGLRAALLADREHAPAVAFEGRILAGRSWMDRGDPRSAVRAFRRALDGIQTDPDAGPLLGRAHHWLFAAYSAAGVPNTAGLYLRKAQRAYGAAHPRMSCLDADAANVLLIAGRYGDAAALLAPVIERITPGHAHRTARANLTLALAGAGRRVSALESMRALRQDADNAAAPGAAWVWLTLARASMLLGLGRRAVREDAEAARRLATRTGEADTRAAAVRLLAAR